MASPLIVRDLGICDYVSTLAAMQTFTATRSPATVDELWVLQHPPVFTLGLNGKLEHLLEPGNIPVVKTDRGGQVTYHGPGQWVVYCLFDVRRAELGVRALVSLLERSVIEILADYQIEGDTKPDAPGVYVEGRKLASLGLRIRRGCSYHGLSLNVAMDLAPFQRINPCGYPGLAMTQLKDLGVSASLFAIKDVLLASMQRIMGYTVVKVESELPVG